MLSRFFKGQQDTVSAQTLAAFDRDLHKGVAAINAADSKVERIVHDPLPVFTGTSMDTNRTGFRGLAGILRDVEKLKRDVSDIEASAVKLTNEGYQTAEVAKATVADMAKELDEVKSALGQITNMPPAE